MLAIKHLEKCIGCGSCADECPMGVLNVAETVEIVNSEGCIECGTYIELCPMDDVLALE